MILTADSGVMSDFLTIRGALQAITLGLYLDRALN